MEFKGYQLVEPDFTGSLFANGVDSGVSVSILCWLVDTMAARKELQVLPVSLELIVANYVGPYPCMALHYLDPNATEDVSPLVEAWSEELVNGAGFNAYFDYVTTHSARIAEFVQHFQAMCDAYYAQRPGNSATTLPSPRPSVT